MTPLKRNKLVCESFDRCDRGICILRLGFLQLKLISKTLPHSLRLQISVTCVALKDGIISQNKCLRTSFLYLGLEGSHK